MTNETKVTSLPLSEIKVDQACQARAAMNDETIDDYVEVMKEKGDEPFPAVVVFYDGTDFWLSDGFHRRAAAVKAGLTTLKARIHQGTQRDAILHSVGANATHGLRRSNADKRHAVSILLGDKEWSSWSNREIARRCGVDEWLVRKLKEEQAPQIVSAGKPQTARKVERNGTQYEMKTGSIGKKERSPLQPEIDNEPEQVWDHARQPTTTDNTTELRHHEQTASSEQGRRTDEVQLHDLMSAWSRALEEVRQAFLAGIGASLIRQAEAGPGLIEDEPSQEPEMVQSPKQSDREPSELAGVSAAELRENALFEMWKDYKHNTQVTGRQWVLNGCPSEYHDSHFTVSERLEPFRAAALVATQQEREDFLELSRAA